MGARGRQKAVADSAGRLASIVDAMMQTGFYPDSPARVELKQTHISYVFVAGESVYKIKQPVHFPFLDCSNLADRFRYCCEEMRLQRAPFPGVYRGVFAILKRGDSFVLGPKVDAELPEAVEYAVKMRRLPDDRMLDRLLAADQVDSDKIRAIAGRIVGISCERAVESWMDLRFGGRHLAQPGRGNRRTRRSLDMRFANSNSRQSTPSAAASSRLTGVD